MEDTKKTIQLSASTLQLLSFFVSYLISSLLLSGQGHVEVLFCNKHLHKYTLRDKRQRRSLERRVLM